MINQLSLIIPVHNEEKYIKNFILEWDSCLSKQFQKYEIIICEDGSTDNTVEVITSIKKQNEKIKINSKRQLRGYTKALIDGAIDANYENILFVDSDGQYDHNDLIKFLDESKYLKRNFILKGKRINRQDNYLRKTYSFLFGKLFSILFKNSLKDPSSTFVLVKKETFLFLNDYLKYGKEGFWWVFCAACTQENIKINEIGINHKPRYDGSTQVYSLRKMPNIIFKNIISLLKVKFHN
jgi:dolichol-phosphate mannosyltransferase